MRNKTGKAGWDQIGVVTFRNLEFSLWEMGSCWRILSQQCKAGGNPKAWHFMPGSHDLPSMRKVLRELELGPLHQCFSVYHPKDSGLFMRVHQVKTSCIITSRHKASLAFFTSLPLH